MPKKLTTAQRDQVLTHPPSLAHPVAHHPGGSPLKQESGATAEPHQADHLDQVMARAHRRHPDARTAERRQAHHLDEAIRQAEAAGGFADLQGKGKPLAFRREAGLATQDERWLTNHILKNADYLPPWVAVSRAGERARDRSAQAVDAWRRAPQGEAREQWATALTAAWEAENDTLRKWNRHVPDPSMQRYPIPVARRWERLHEAGQQGDRAGGED